MTKDTRNGTPGQHKPHRPHTYPFPGGVDQLHAKLADLHSRLRGELSKARRGKEPLVQAERAQRALQAIEELSELTAAPAWVLEQPEIDTRPRKRFVRHGHLRKGLLRVLRQSTKEWLTASEISEEMVRLHRLRLSPSELDYFTQAVRLALYAMRTKGQAQSKHPPTRGRAAQEQQWRLGPVFTRPGDKGAVATSRASSPHRLVAQATTTLPTLKAA